MSEKLTTRAEDYSRWYNELVVRADLAEQSGVRGCMVIKPYGYAIWEKMRDYLDARFKETGHQNAYFPIFIPKSYFSKEAHHVDGFAKECAVVTHYRLKNAEDGSGIVVDPDAKLEEELIVRPTSETIIWDTYRRWIQSYRDLPILVNQWANVVRWEMRTRLFLRTAEFLWQEGHTAHATREEAIAEAQKMLDVYAEFAENIMAVPVIKGHKTENERFAGAEDTYCIEAMMQDGKALQAGTSHFLGQNFAKAFDVKYADKDNNMSYVWATSWGVSTRLMGALIMTHSDDNGLVLPPALAPIEVVMVPIYKNKEQYDILCKKMSETAAALRAEGISVKIDDDDSQKPGWKFHEYELKGVPVRLVLGPKDLEKDQYEVARRDTMTKEFMPMENIVESVKNLLNDIQKNLYNKALALRTERTYKVNTWEEFLDVINVKCGFALAPWDGTTETEEKIKELTKATIRCIPLDSVEEDGVDMLTGKPSKRRVVFAKAY
ncbi:MAG: proline--tRNA ligase [Flavobacteriales bacterium]|nr:proline--tRNA ligase [Flavobacteriales bacterium]